MPLSQGKADTSNSHSGLLKRPHVGLLTAQNLLFTWGLASLEEEGSHLMNLLISQLSNVSRAMNTSCVQRTGLWERQEMQSIPLL